MNRNFSETQKISNLKDALKDVVISDETVGSLPLTELLLRLMRQ